MIEIHIYLRDEKYYVVLRHEDGSEEISEQSWDTREECEEAIRQYAKERGGQVRRVN